VGAVKGEAMAAGRAVRTVGALALVVGLVLAGGPPAGAEPYEDGAPSWAGARYANSPRTGWNTTSSDDYIWDIAQIGNRIYVAGRFGGIRYGSRGDVSGRSYLVALRADTGDVIWDFRPRLDGTVRTLAVGDDGRRLYVGGEFNRVSGLNRRGIVALTPGGSVVQGFRANAGGGPVRSIVATRRFLYVGGGFGSINGQGRQGLARLHRDGGQVDRTWNARAEGGAVYTLEMPPSRDRLYIGGDFDEINGRSNTERLAAVHTDDGSLVESFDAYTGRVVFDLLADSRGRVWTALDGAGGRAQVLENDGDEIRAWATDGDVQTIERIGDRVFFAGHELVPSDREIATVSYDSPRDWDTSSFNPNLAGSVWALHADGNDLWVGGESARPFHGFGRYPAR